MNPGDPINIYRTQRKRFEAREAPEGTAEQLSEEAQKEGAWLEVLWTEEARRAAADLISEGDVLQWANRNWRRELAAWMHPRRQGDGLIVPRLLAPVSRTVVRTFDMGKAVGAEDRKIAEESPFLAVLGTTEDIPTDWLNAGQAMERVLLNAAQKGMQAGYMNQPIQVACLRPKLQHLLKSRGFPQLLFRLGYPLKDLPPTPRRGLNQVI